MQVILDKNSLAVKHISASESAEKADPLDRIAKMLAQAFVEERQAKGGANRCKEN